MRIGCSPFSFFCGPFFLQGTLRARGGGRQTAAPACLSLLVYLCWWCCWCWLLPPPASALTLLIHMPVCAPISVLLSAFSHAKAASACRVPSAAAATLPGPLPGLINGIWVFGVQILVECAAFLSSALFFQCPFFSSAFFSAGCLPWVA